MGVNKAGSLAQKLAPARSNHSLRRPHWATHLSVSRRSHPAPAPVGRFVSAPIWSSDMKLQVTRIEGFKW